MRNIKWIIIALVLGFLSFVPVVTVNVVPEWSLRLVDETGEPVPNARVDQSWKDYSLEFFLSRHFDESLSSDADGIVRFPVRDIQVSTIQMVAAKIRGIILRIDPHASYGPGSL
ncbi:MAG: hypothetical protein ABI857_02810 [Acidobacteriota bacterium]